MSTNIDTLTLDQLLWALAGANYDGTGQVYVLPDSVREPCPCPTFYKPQGPSRCESCTEASKKYDCAKHGDACTYCRTLGYTPSGSLEVWLDVAGLLGLGKVTFWQGPPIRVEVETLTYPRLGFQGNGTSRLEAVLRALALALQAQGEKLEVPSAPGRPG